MHSAIAPAPGFAAAVPDNGYRWWYIDGVSDDGSHALTIIVFVGSVFSPYYAAARRRGDANPEDFCAMNVALYNPGGKRWAMTERNGANLRRDGQMMAVGPSHIHWDGRRISLAIDEVGVPLPSRLRGEVHLELPGITDTAYSLDRANRHHWWPIAPSCRVQVAMQSPALNWTGHAYFDSNWGAEPLEAGFSDWDWSRATLGDGGSLVQYHARMRDPTLPERTLALRFDAAGAVTELAPLPSQALPRGPIWRVARASQADPGASISVTKTFEDTPFYTRSLLSTQLLGERVEAVHESLCLQRFSRRWVQTLLPFRMPRVKRVTLPQEQPAS